jgi:hypothetical protein
VKVKKVSDCPQEDYSLKLSDKFRRNCKQMRQLNLENEFSNFSSLEMKCHSDDMADLECECENYFRQEKSVTHEESKENSNCSC